MKQPTIHQNQLGKRELAEFIDIFEKIQSGKIKYNAAKADAFRKEHKIGEYREWEIDLKRIAEIDEMVKQGEAHMWEVKDSSKSTGTGNNRKRPGGKVAGCVGGGKLQRAAEEAKLIAEIENL